MAELYIRMDEFRIIKTAYWTTDFTPPSISYDIHGEDPARPTTTDSTTTDSTTTDTTDTTDTTESTTTDTTTTGTTTTGTTTDTTTTLPGEIVHIVNDSAQWRPATETGWQRGYVTLGNGAGPFNSVILFSNVPIPIHAELISANIELTSMNKWSKNNCNVNIYFNDVDSATFPENAPAAQDLVLTTATPWNNIETWEAATPSTSPDIKDTLQEVIDREGWLEDNNLQLVIHDNSSTSWALRQVSSTGVVKLKVNYDPVSPGDEIAAINVVTSPVITGSNTLSSPTNGFDLNATNFAEVQGSGDWIKIDFGRNRNIGQIRVQAGPDSPGTQDIYLQYSTDDVNWTTIFNWVGQEYYSTLTPWKNIRDEVRYIRLFKVGANYMRLYYMGIRLRVGYDDILETLTPTDTISLSGDGIDILEVAAQSLVVSPTITASHGISDSTKGFDIDANSYLTVNSDANPCWAKLDLGELKYVSLIRCQAGPDNPGIHDMALEYSTDDTNWTTVYSWLGQAYYTSPTRWKSIEDHVRYIRIVRYNHSNYMRVFYVGVCSRSTEVIVTQTNLAQWVPGYWWDLNYGRFGSASGSWKFAVLFTAASIPAGATIVSAVASFHSNVEASSSSPINVNMYFNNVADATFPSNGVQAEALVLTDAVPWLNIESWSLGPWYNSPDLKDILQTVIDNPSWVSGNKLQLVVRDIDTVNGRIRSISSAGVVKLTINYST